MSINKTNDESIKDFLKIKNGCLYYVIDNKQKTKKIDPPQFVNFVQKYLLTTNEEQYSKTIDLSRLRVFTFLVINNGINPVKCQVELSPDGTTWDSFNELEHTIAPGRRMAIVPQYFLHYARIMYKNDQTSFDSDITVWFQGQSQG